MHEKTRREKRHARHRIATNIQFRCIFYAPRVLSCVPSSRIRSRYIFLEEQMYFPRLSRFLPSPALSPSRGRIGAYSAIPRFRITIMSSSASASLFASFSRVWHLFPFLSPRTLSSPEKFRATGFAKCPKLHLPVLSPSAVVDTRLGSSL